MAEYSHVVVEVYEQVYKCVQLPVQPDSQRVGWVPTPVSD